MTLPINSSRFSGTRPSEIGSKPLDSSYVVAGCFTLSIPFALCTRYLHQVSSQVFRISKLASIVEKFIEDIAEGNQTILDFAPSQKQASLRSSVQPPYLLPSLGIRYTSALAVSLINKSDFNPKTKKVAESAILILGGGILASASLFNLYTYHTSLVEDKSVLYFSLFNGLMATSFLLPNK